MGGLGSYYYAQKMGKQRAKKRREENEAAKAVKSEKKKLKQPIKEVGNNQYKHQDSFKFEE